MFQCAAAIGYAKKYNVGWSCPEDTKEVPRFHEFFPNLPKYPGHEFRRYNVADPSQFDYSPIPFHPNGVKLVGFFQSEKFFEDAHDEIRKAFKLNIDPVDAVSIHVRRGDYVIHANSFPPVTKDYVNIAMRWIPATERRIIFSDDIEWCRKTFGKKYEYSEGRSELEDLSLMASCSHHIVANSSFSWWGAWLGHNLNKIVVSPHYTSWFGPGFTGAPPKDLIPDSWFQIKFR